MKKIHYIALIALVEAFLFQGCRLNPSLMLKTGKDYKYSKFSTEPPPLYKISVNDELRFSIYSNDGFKLIDITTMVGENAFGGMGTGRSVGNSYKVEFDGTVKFPLLGRVQLKGMTVREAEQFLEEKYASFYNKPYVLLEVFNRRVMIFPGSPGTAKVVPL
ncbi:MAG TPA: polysaccharide biosynthesis/export family protein, partial [Bacteroidia bacterium]